MTKQEEIMEGVDKILNKAIGDDEGVITYEILSYLHSQGVVIKVERELPYKWNVIKRKHSHRPYKEFTTHALEDKFGNIFGYIQKYQSLTGYKCFEKPARFSIYLGNERWAHSYKSVPTLKEARRMLIDQFLSSKDNPDKNIPTGLVAVEPLV